MIPCGVNAVALGKMVARGLTPGRDFRVPENGYPSHSFACATPSAYHISPKMHQEATIKSHLIPIKNLKNFNVLKPMLVMF